MLYKLIFIHLAEIFNQSGIMKMESVYNNIFLTTLLWKRNHVSIECEYWIGHAHRMLKWKDKKSKKIQQLHKRGISSKT